MFTLLSYNIYFGKKLTQIVDWIAKEETKNSPFDIVCFQEFPSEKINSFMSTRNTKTGYVFTPSISLKKKDYGQLTLFNKEKFKLLKSTELALGGSHIEKKVAQLFRRSTHRKSLLTLFKTQSNKRLMIANTHLTSISLNGHRISQLRKICEQMKECTRGLIVGDLNYTSRLPRLSLRRLTKKYGFEDATRKINTHRIFMIKHQLDYIFTKAIRVTDVKVNPTSFSDHYPLTAQFKI